MKLSIVALGSRGDVQPYVALGTGLQEAGHKVQIITDPTFEDFIRAQGLDFLCVKADPQRALSENVQKIGTNPIRLNRWIKNHFESLARQAYADLLQACQEADALVASNLAFPAFDIAEVLGIPCLATSLQPFNPTRSFRSVTSPRLPDWLPFKGSFHWWGFRLSNWLFFWMIRDTENECRRDILGLGPIPWKRYASIDVSKTPIIYGYSSHVLPKPPDWGDWLHVTGYWFLDQATGWEIPHRLMDFLEAGPAPVYVGFGSMIVQGAEAITRLVMESLDRANMRGILLGEWAELGALDMPNRVLKVDEVPHDWLFPRVAAVVHHGGAGTTAASMRAGVPTIVVPFFGDQFFWADRIYELGVGPKPIPRKRLNVANLANAMRVATEDEAIRKRAADLGRRLRAENGVANAVSLVEHYLTGI